MARTRTTPVEFHSGGIISPHEFDLYSLNNEAQFFFWDTYLDGMAEVFLSAYGRGYHEPHTDQYSNGCFPVIT